jgi:CheY-like chemotaxis protein
VRILVADDDPVIRRLLGSILVRGGYDVLYASDGEAAWSVLQEQSVDLVISDHSMPGCTGLELLRQIRATPSCASLPVIMITGTGCDDSIAQEAVRVGVSGFLSKLLNPDVLLPAVARALHLTNV